jgi:NAD-dependent dihydropyrimidine dehydrogenase PreA subunit
MDWLKTLIETAFRFFGFPTQTGLQVFGQPSPDAPVLVTCNFDLTVCRVAKVLRENKVDCYLLVAPTKGINVWCAAGGGIFNAHSVISVVKTSGIADKVTHRRLILPQLAAPGVDVQRVKEETGWRCRFGPVYASDIPAYVANNFKKTDAMRRARFPLADRLEMAVMWAGPLSILAVIVLLFFNRGALPGVLALIWGLALGMFVFFEPVIRYVPGRVGLQKTTVLGLLVAVGLIGYGLSVGNWTISQLVGWGAAALGLSLLLGFDLEGQSPLYAGATITYWAAHWPRLLDLADRVGFPIEHSFTVSVDNDRCQGCGTCVEVCPKGVYELYRLDGKKRSRVMELAACEQCTACVKQCPERAVVAEPPIRTFDR